MPRAAPVTIATRPASMPAGCGTINLPRGGRAGNSDEKRLPSVCGRRGSGCVSDGAGDGPAHRARDAGGPAAGARGRGRLVRVRTSKKRCHVEMVGLARCRRRAARPVVSERSSSPPRPVSATGRPSSCRRRGRTCAMLTGYSPGSGLARLKTKAGCRRRRPSSTRSPRRSRGASTGSRPAFRSLRPRGRWRDQADEPRSSEAARRGRAGASPSPCCSRATRNGAYPSPS